MFFFCGIWLLRDIFHWKSNIYVFTISCNKTCEQWFDESSCKIFRWLLKNSFIRKYYCIIWLMIRVIEHHWYVEFISRNHQSPNWRIISRAFNINALQLDMLNCCYCVCMYVDYMQWMWCIWWVWSWLVSINFARTFLLGVDMCKSQSTDKIRWGNQIVMLNVEDVKLVKMKIPHILPGKKTLRRSSALLCPAPLHPVADELHQ